MDAGVTPSFMITAQSDSKKWEPIDALLVQAFHILEAERCPSCGNYIWLCRSTDQRLEVKVEPVKCDGKAAIDLSEKNTKDKEPGVSYRPVYKDSRDEIPLHHFRKRYYDAKRQEAEEAADPELVD